MSFKDDVDDFAENAELALRSVFVGSVDEVHTSVVFGSAITGSPGQQKPGYWAGRLGLSEGDLRRSWIKRFTGLWEGRVTTNLIYAEFIESGDYTQRSPVPRPEFGYGHSVKLTRAGWQLIVNHVAGRVSQPGIIIVTPRTNPV